MAPEKDGGEESWFQYRRLVLAELERANKAMVALHEKIDRNSAAHGDEISKLQKEHSEDIGKLRERIVAIETRAAVLGTIGGILVSIIIGLFKFLPIK